MISCSVGTTALRTSILMQQKLNSTSQKWNTFKVGFGNPAGDYWLINHAIHNLTQNGGCSLLVQLQSSADNQWYMAQYSICIVNPESAGYKRHVGGYTGNTTGALSYHNEMLCITHDRDQDTSEINCASTYLEVNWYLDYSYADMNLGCINGTNWIAWYYLPPGYFLFSSRLCRICD